MCMMLRPRLLALATLAAWTAPRPAAATCTLTNLTTLPLTTVGGHIYVPVSINETEGLFLLDTGAATTILTGDFAARAHVGMDTHAGRSVLSGVGDRETLPVNQAHARRTDIGKISFPDWEYIVLPQQAGGIGATERDGILGMDFLHFVDIDIDFQANTVTLWRLQGCTDIHPEWQGDYDAIPLKHTAGQNVTMPIFVDNAFLNVTFDTGAGGFLLTREAAARAGVTDAMLNADRDAGGVGVGGRFAAVVHHFKLLLVGSGEFPNPAIAVETEGRHNSYADGLLGLRYIKPHKLWLSYATNTLFVQRAGK
jgi:predicted aspartyl protease